MLMPSRTSRSLPTHLSSPMDAWKSATMVDLTSAEAGLGRGYASYHVNYHTPANDLVNLNHLAEQWRTGCASS